MKVGRLTFNGGSHAWQRQPPGPALALVCLVPLVGAGSMVGEDRIMQHRVRALPAVLAVLAITSHDAR